MYRIHFDPTIGQFVIQVLRFGFIWANVRHIISEELTDELSNEILKFKTYINAQSHVVSIGLDELYEDRSDNVLRKYLRAQ